MAYNSSAHSVQYKGFIILHCGEHVIASFLGAHTWPETALSYLVLLFFMSVSLSALCDTVTIYCLNAQ